MGISELEPSVRMSMSHIKTAIDYASRLEGESGAKALSCFDHHAHEAVHQLRLWAAANNLEVQDWMKT